MSYLVIDDFKLGMDRRKARVSGAIGALWEGINGQINRGGDFERRKKFVAKYTLPAGTFSEAQVNNQIFVFGSGADPGVPVGVTYQRLQHTSTANMSDVLSITTFSGKLYVVASFDNGDIFHYYNGSRVTDWDGISSAVSSNNAVASALATKIDAQAAYVASAVGAVVTITAATAGIPFTIAKSTINGGSTNDQAITLAQTQANVSSVTETRATATLTVTGGSASAGVNKLTALKIDGVEVLNVAVDWVTSNTATATAIANQINSYASTPEYTAVAVGAVVTITAAAGTGAGPNGFVLTPTVGGNLTTSVSNMGGGVTAVSAVAQVYTATISGTFEALDTFILTIDGINYAVSGASAGTGITALTYRLKIYSVTNSLLYFSALSAPAQFSGGIGSGSVNMVDQHAGNEPLVGVQAYQNRMAIFSRTNIQIWDIQADPLNNSFQQNIENTGARTSRSITQYGNIDVFYLSDSGVRSLRARDASNAPAVNDVGVAIDAFLLAYIDTLSDTQVAKACSIIGPDGRYWLAVGQRIFLFTFFPGSKINAWTYYDLIDEIGSDYITDMVKTAGDRVYVRAGNTIYLFGGDSNVVYPEDDEITATISLPFLSGGKPATMKGVTGFDIGCTGTWKAELLINPAREDVALEIGTFHEPTYSQPRETIQHPTAMFAIRLTCNKGGAAAVSNMAIHYEAQEAG